MSHLFFPSRFCCGGGDDRFAVDGVGPVVFPYPCMYPEQYDYMTALKHAILDSSKVCDPLLAPIPTPRFSHASSPLTDTPLNHTAQGRRGGRVAA